MLLASASLLTAQEGPSGGGKAASPSASEKPGQTSGSGNSARDSAPGQMKEPGSSAKQDAPGRMKDQQGNARDVAPGQTKDSDKNRDAADSKDRDRRDGPSGNNANRDSKNNDRDVTKTGDRADGKKAKGSVKNVSPEQRTKVRTTFSRHRVEPARNLNIDINVGVSVPRNVRFYTIPADILVVVPEYQDYSYFIVGDQVVIVDPDTYEIVDVIVIA